MTNAASLNPLANPFKYCRYECGTLIFRDDSIEGPPHMKWRERYTGEIHDMERCCHVINQKEGITDAMGAVVKKK